MWALVLHNSISLGGRIHRPLAYVSRLRVNNVLHVGEFNYITLLMKNVQFGPVVNLFQLSITGYALGIFVL